MTQTGALQIDRYDFLRFVDAQQSVYSSILTELGAGRKRGHWMWFVFPQADGLGNSATAREYAIRSTGEALAYIDHPLLGARLIACVETVLNHSDRSAHELFGSPDDLKFRASMTLFAKIGGGPSFQSALDAFYDGKPDAASLSILANWA
jgi:uncharacterized protein (DUF1810 family)